jgi:hypothetical protein
MKKFGMENCENFVRGTIRFKGFSFIISNFHDKGLTSEDPVPSDIKTLKDLTNSRIKKVGEVHPLAREAFKDSFDGLSKEDQELTLKLMSDIDVSYLPKDDLP